MAQLIYGDESGFTGNNLLDPERPYFAYATVASDPDYASDVVQRAIRDFRLQGSELKGKNLIRYDRGRKAIASVLSAFSDRALVQVYNKGYTLATKFFEYVIEPVLADQNSIFYGCGFHRWVSAFVYLEVMTDGERAAQVLGRFQELMWERDPSALDGLFPTAGLQADGSDVLQNLETFAACHRDVIAADVAAHSGNNPLYRWMLDVSDGALFNLLQMWGERFDSLDVICDESNPLRDFGPRFDIMIGRTDRHYARFGDKVQPLIFNLARPIQFGSSHDHAGIQVADLFATTATYVFRNSGSEELAPLKSLIIPAIHHAVLPDLEVLDLRTPAPFANRLVLYALVERSLKKQDLFTDMPEFIQAALEKHADYLQSPEGQLVASSFERGADD